MNLLKTWKCNFVTCLSFCGNRSQIENNEQYVTSTPNISEDVTQIHVVVKKISLAKLPGLLDLNLNLI